MTGYKAEFKNTGTLTSAYPHSPTDTGASISDYLNARLSEGWRLRHVTGDLGGDPCFIFEAFAKD
jgi:hypothetical protein